jgi:hypothetical protein
LAILKLQGYAGETGDNEWLTTAAGEIVSGSKQPRFHRESVYGALSTLFDRIAAINKDCKAGFKITQAVAFGDFLTERATVKLLMSESSWHGGRWTCAETEARAIS